MSNFVDKILMESYNWSDQIPAKYGFISRDTTKFPLPENKWDIVNEMEKQIKNSGKSLPELNIDPQLLVHSSNDEGKLIVAKFHGMYFLINGVVKIIRNPSRPEDFVKVKIMDLDTYEIGNPTLTNYTNGPTF